MRKILIALAQLLENEFVSKNMFKHVFIYDESEIQTLLKARDIPAIIITPNGEDSVTSPIANTTMIQCNIRMRMVAKSADSKKYTLRSEENSIFDLTKSLRRVILSNKTLSGEVFELDKMWSVRDLQVLHKSQGYFNARDIYIKYRKLEAYTGMRNDQVSLEVPEGIKKNPLPRGVDF